MISLQNIHQEFVVGSGKHTALKDVSLKISEAEIAVLMGPSGSGKSTLLNIIGGLLTPTSGMVKLNEQELALLNDNELSRMRNRLVGFVFQNFNLLPVLTAFKNIEYPLLLLGIPSNKRKQMVNDILHKVGLGDMGDRIPSQMSGGQQQRIAIGRALVTKPKVIICDEPTANLDSETARDILELMLNLNDQLRATLIFSTHDPRIACIATSLYTLCDGYIK